MRKIDIIAGARPNFMKIAPIIHALRAAQIKGSDLGFRLIHTGQHSDSACLTALQNYYENEPSAKAFKGKFPAKIGIGIGIEIAIAIEFATAIPIVPDIYYR